MRRCSSSWARRCRRVRNTSAALVEVLEDRALLAIGVIVADRNPVTTATTNTQFDPSIDIGVEGTVVVAWTHQTAAGNTDVRFRRHTSTGLELDAGDRSVNHVTSGLEGKPNVSVSPFGSFVIGYEAQDSGGDGDIYFDIYDVGGVFVRKVQVSAIESAGQYEIDVATAPNGNIVVAWREVDSTTGGGDIKARVFNSQGDTLTPLIYVATSTGREETTPSVAVDANGNFVVAYTIDLSSVAFVRFTADGNGVGGERFLIPSVGDVGYSYFLPSVGRAYDGSFVVGYSVAPPSSPTFGVWELFSPEGIQRAEGVLGPGPMTSMDMDAFGNFVEGWNPDVGGGDTQIWATFFDSQGRRGETVDVNRLAAGSQMSHSVAMANNVLVGAYYDPNQSGNVEFSILEQRRAKFGVARPNDKGGLAFYLDSNLNAYFDQFDLVFNFGLAGDIVLVGDWNSDGIDKVGVGRPNGTGGLKFYLDFNGNRTFDIQDAVYDFGLVGDIIVVGDWNGDGVDDLGVARPNGLGGLVFSLDSNGNRTFDQNDAVFNFGLANDAIVVGDWNGDGFEELGVARSNGFGGLTFSLDSNGSRAFEANQDAVFNFGLAGDRIVVGDWDGDGVDGLGVARPNPGGGLGASLDWNENFGFDVTDALLAFDFGLPADILVVGKWAQTALRSV